MGDDKPVRDIAEAIEKVMMKAHTPRELDKMGMYSMEDGKFKPVSIHNLSFDSQQNQLEPSYYWLLDWVGERGWKWEKLVDNFMASPGSGQFSEMNMKATKMQEEGMKILGGMNQIIKSVLNLVYDLKEFELRLSHYDDASSEDKQKKEEGMLALKQIWLDNVDIKKGRGAIHQMATMEMGYSTLREAFMMANSIDDLKKMNDDEEGGLINDQVMRILIPRVGEFLKWVDYSEKELRKRFSIEKNYLKSQVETIKLYSGWMKPYLVAAEKLKQKGFEGDAALVNSFSTSMFQLELFTQRKVGLEGPHEEYNFKRNYNSIMVIDFEFRGHVSQRVTQKGDYGFDKGGLMNIRYKSYALNDEEVAAAKKMLDDADREATLNFSQNVAEDALNDLKEDLDYFLMSDEEKENVKFESTKEEKQSQDINPFAALFGMGSKKKKPKKSKDGKDEAVAPEDIKGDNFVEKMARGEAGIKAADFLYLAFDIYKKAHRMASVSGEGFDSYDEEKLDDYAEGGDVGLTDIFKGKDSRI